MRQLFQILIFILIISPIYGQSKLIGEYKSNFAAYGIMSSDLKINNDSSFILNVSIPQGHKIYNGRWSSHRDTVKLIYQVIDLSNDPYYQGNDTIQKMKYQERYLFEKKRLYLITDSGIVRQTDGYFNLKKYNSSHGQIYYSKHEYYLKKL